jgi:Na+/H+ antiporter NhaD/arsenite permease-like protein
VSSNDIVCLAMTPVLVHGCLRRRLDPVPFLLALACAANIGSALTLIGNPQNMLIGESLALSFVGYSGRAALPVLLGLAAVWLLVSWQTRGCWELEGADATSRPGEPAAPAAVHLDRWQSAKGLAVAAALVGLFLFSEAPRELAALAGAGLLLTSRRLHSRSMLGLVDWELLVLFIGLFVVNHAFQQSGAAERVLDAAAGAGVALNTPAALFAGASVLSNVVSNVPAVILMLPLARDAESGTLLALSSTFAGNLLIVGSIANIIVVAAAERAGIRIGWRRHARIGVPVTLVTLVLAWILRAGAWP